MSQRIDLTPQLSPVGVDAFPPRGDEAPGPRAGAVRGGHIPPEAAEVAAPGPARAAARAAAPAMNRNLAGVAAPGREGFWSRVGRAFQNLKEKLFGPGFQLPPSVTLTMPDGGRIDFPSSRLTAMIKALPKAERAEAAANISGILQGRIDAGKATLERVFAGTANPPAGTADVADVMLFLETRALQAGHDFTEGAFNVADPDGRLMHWLDSSPERYQRSSSHLTNLQEQIVDGHLNTHRGIDIPAGMSGLASGKNTLLFGTIPADDTLGTERRLFLKMESHGCRLNTLTMFHSRDYARGQAAGAQADRPVRASDFKSMFGHALSYFATRGKGSAAGSRKERIPDTVKSAYETLQKAAGKMDERCAQILRSHEPAATGSGIRFMVHNVNLAYESLSGNDELRGLADAFLQTVDRMPDHSQLRIRIGNEVIFDQVDLF